MFEAAFGGVPRFIHSLANWLINEDQEVTVMGATFASIQSKHMSKHVVEEEYQKIVARQENLRSVHPPYAIFLLSRLWLSLLWILKIILLHRRLPITLIHAQDTGYSGLAAVISGKLLGIPVVISAHGLRHHTLEKVIHGKFRSTLLRLEKFTESLSIKFSDKVIIVNSVMKSYYNPVVYKKIHTIPIPIKLKDYIYSYINRKEVRTEFGIDDNVIVIGYIGRFDPEKNLLNLVKSFATALKENEQMVLLMVGTGSLESELKEVVINYDIQDKVIFSGVRNDIGRILSGLDIFVLPSYTEGLSMALLEAMASGRAVICSDIPFNRELVVDRKEAILINPYDLESIRFAIELLGKDEPLRLKLGENAKLKTFQYDESIIFPKLLQFYKNLVHSKTQVSKIDK